jgi:hypothetical protein
MDGRLEIYTLGGVRILSGGEPIAGLIQRKVEMLLVYLASTRRAQLRELLADLLWDELPQSQALAYLSVARMADDAGAGRLRQRVLCVPRADGGRAGAVRVEVRGLL